MPDTGLESKDPMLEKAGLWFSQHPGKTKCQETRGIIYITGHKECAFKWLLKIVIGAFAFGR